MTHLQEIFSLNLIFYLYITSCKWELVSWCINMWMAYYHSLWNEQTICYKQPNTFTRQHRLFHTSKGRTSMHKVSVISVHVFGMRYRQKLMWKYQYLSSKTWQRYFFWKINYKFFTQDNTSLINLQYIHELWLCMYGYPLILEYITLCLFLLLSIICPCTICTYYVYID